MIAFTPDKLPAPNSDLEEANQLIAELKKVAELVEVLKTTLDVLDKKFSPDTR